MYEVDNTPLQYPIQKLYGYTLIDDTKNMKQEPHSLLFNNSEDDMAAMIIKDGGKIIGIKMPLFKCLLLLDGLTLLANDPRMDERAVREVDDMIEGLVITLSKASPRFAQLVTDVTDKIMEVN